jgi:hypothetical protein
MNVGSYFHCLHFFIHFSWQPRYQKLVLFLPGGKELTAELLVEQQRAYAFADGRVLFHFILKFSVLELNSHKAVM